MATGPEMPELLRTFDEITPGWVRSLLELHFGSDIPEIAAVTIAPIGTGNASDTRRIAIDYAATTSLPKSLICKFHPRDEAARLAQAASGANAREAASYVLVADRSGCRIPRPYLVAVDDTRFNLVLEDLTTTGSMGDQIAGCSLAEAEAVIDELARLHSSFVGLDMPTMPACMLHMADVADRWGEAIRTGASVARDRFGEQLTASDYAEIDWAAELTNGWLRHPQRHLTFTHGDPRVDNIAFEQQDGHCRAVLLDWQMAGLRAPMYDVAYFLTSSLPTDLRREHEQELVRRYLDRTAGVSENGGFDDYRTLMLANFSLTILSIVALPRTPQVDLMLLTLLRRNIAAVQDWNSLAAIAKVLEGIPA